MDTPTSKLVPPFLTRVGLRDPWAVLAIALAAVIAAAPGLLRLRLRTDGYALVPTNRAEINTDKELRERFGARDLLIVLVRSERPEGIYNARSLALIRQLTEDLQQLPGITPDHVTSLATEYSFRVVPGSIKLRRLLDPLPRSAEAIAEFREDLARIALHDGTLISRDHKAAALLVGAPPTADRTELYAQVCQLLADRATDGIRLEVTGAVVAEALLGLHILEDLGLPQGLLGIPSTRPAESPDASGLAARALGLIRRIGLLPWVMLLMTLIFLLCFRGIGAAVFPLIEVGGCLVIIFGLMGWLGVPVYLTTAVMPILLIALGVADEIHVFTRYLQERQARPDATVREALATTLTELHRPIVLTSATTMIGLASFVLSPLPAVRAFGLFSAIGVGLCMVWSLAVIPAMILLCPPRWFARQNRPEESGVASGAMFERLAHVLARRRWAVVAIALVLGVAGVFGATRVQVQDSWIDGFAPDSAFARTTRYFNEQFLGVHVLLAEVAAPDVVRQGRLAERDVSHREVRLPAKDIPDPNYIAGRYLALRREGSAPATPEDSPSEARAARLRSYLDVFEARIAAVRYEDGRVVAVLEPDRGSPRLSMDLQPSDFLTFEIRRKPYTEPALLHQVEKFEQFLRGQADVTVGGVLGPATYLATANFVGGGATESRRVIPESAERVQWCLDQYGRLRGPERLGQLFDEHYTRGLLTIFLKNANFRDVGVLLERLRQYEREHLLPEGLSLALGGDVAVSQTLIDSIVNTQVRSLGGALVGIIAVIAVLTRSLRRGLIVVLPCTFSILIDFAVMGWAGIPLGVATSMFAAMTLGVGVDFAIHLGERYELEKSRGADSPTAMARTLRFVGAATTVDALAVAGGAGLLVFSQVPANARLGALLVLSLLGCLATTLMLLPALLVRAQASIAHEPAIAPGACTPPTAEAAGVP